MIGKVRPRPTEGARSLHDLMEQRIRHRLPAPDPVDTDDASVAVTAGVRWHGLADLDLYLRVDVDGQTKTVSYTSPGAFDAFPFAQLRRDVQSGPGPEEILLSAWLPGTYRVSVHTFRGELDRARPAVTISQNYRYGSRGWDTILASFRADRLRRCVHAEAP